MLGPISDAVPCFAFFLPRPQFFEVPCCGWACRKHGMAWRCAAFLWRCTRGVALHTCNVYSGSQLKFKWSPNMVQACCERFCDARSQTTRARAAA